WVTLGIERPVDDVTQMPVRLVVDALSFLVLDDLLLLRDDVLGHRVYEEAELVGLGPDRLLERVTRDDLEVVRPVTAGGTVCGTAHSGHQPIEPTRSEILRVEEEEMLEEVREPGASLGLSCRAGVE